MTPMPHFGLKEWFLLLLVLAAAAGARLAYVLSCLANMSAPAPLAVQDRPAVAWVSVEDPPATRRSDELNDLIQNVKEYRWGGSLAPLADVEERTAHAAPGYPWLLGLLARFLDDPEKFLAAVRWLQIALGTLTAGLYFLFARRAFRSALVGTLAGLLCALHPFWIVNTFEMNDGTLVTFLLAAVLFFGARAGQEGDALGSLLYGLGLAGLALVRAALLPFGVVACLWFMLRCRTLPRGWLCALLAFLGYANGLAPWMVRNLQAFHEVVPVADSMYLHLYEGVNAAATGGPQDEKTLRATLSPARLQELLAEKNQPRRYSMLAKDVLERIEADPAGTLHKRLLAAQCFVFGESWLKDGKLAEQTGSLPEEVSRRYAPVLEGVLLFMLLFGLLGWRWTYGWRRESMPASLAVMWIPLPYLLSHAEALSGPRLPLDGVLLCYAAFAVACLLPGVGKVLLRGSSR
jgi:4-amino-4-deoxy-L-arabinose transferase-like glycosyltransferase